MVLSTSKLDVIPVGRQDDSPPLLLLGRECLVLDSKWLSTVDDQCEMSSIQILVEMTYAVHQCQCFLFDLGIIFLTAQQRPRGKCDESFASVRVHMRDYCSNAIGVGVLRGKDGS